MSAVFSDDRIYRYTLERMTERGVGMRVRNAYRSVEVPVPTVAFIGLNPSTADEVVNDATVRRCIGYADRWGYGLMVMLNLFAFRSRNPRRLRETEDPVGPDNDEWLLSTAARVNRVVCCWGAHGTLLERHSTVLSRLREVCDPYALALTKDGLPGHPLYLRADLEPFLLGG